MAVLRWDFLGLGTTLRRTRSEERAGPERRTASENGVTTCGRRREFGALQPAADTEERAGLGANWCGRRRYVKFMDYRWDSEQN